MLVITFMHVVVRSMKLTTLLWLHHQCHQQTVLQSSQTTGVWLLLPLAQRRNQSGSGIFEWLFQHQQTVLMIHPSIHVCSIQAWNQTVCYCIIYSCLLSFYYELKIRGRSTWKNWWIKRMNEIIGYRLGLKKDQQIISGSMKMLQHWKT